MHQVQQRIIKNVRRNGFSRFTVKAVTTNLIPLLLATLALTVCFLRGGAFPFLTPAAAPAASSRALALTPDGTLLLVVNPDSDSLTLLDTKTQTVYAEIPVGDNPRTVATDGERVYVTLQDEHALAVIDLAAQQVIARVPAGYQPYGVLLNAEENTAYVTAQGSDELVMIDTALLTSTAHLPLPDRPRALARAGDTIYITHLLSNTVSILPPGQENVFLPIVMRQASDVMRYASPVKCHASCVTRQATEKTDYRTESGRTTTLPFTAHRSPFTAHRSPLPLFPGSNLVTGIALGPNGRFAYVPHTRSNTANAALTFDTTLFPLVSIIDLEADTHLIGQQFDLGSLDPPGVGLPHDAAVTPDGEELWVVNAASNDLTVINLATRQPAAHVEVGAYPQAILISPDGGTAYVNNTLAGTVSVVDTAAYTVTAAIPVTQIPLPPLLLQGKRLFHSSDDPRLSQDQWISCNSCHFEGGHDGRTWTFGFAGPRNTTGLHGMIATYPLRWSAEWDESADAEFANRRENFGSGLLPDLHCAVNPPDCVNQPPNQGRSYEMDALAAYMDFLALPLSAGHAAGQPLSAAAQRGRALFYDPALGCLDCHPPPLYTDRQTHDVGTATADERIGPAYDTPTLLGLYDSAPYFHDGSAATLAAALTRPTPGDEHNLSDGLTAAELADLIAYLEALPYER